MSICEEKLKLTVNKQQSNPIAKSSKLLNLGGFEDYMQILLLTQ